MALLRADPLRWQALGLVADLALPQGCIGAGFVRNLVWDHLHGHQSDCRAEDVDVLWFDPARATPDHDAALEHRLGAAAPGLRWSVRNQARMHLRNGDAPYTSVIDAMRAWPETATALAAARDGAGCQILAPFGLEDLVAMRLRPTSAAPGKRAAFQDRLRSRRWAARWPLVQILS